MPKKLALLVGCNYSNPPKGLKVKRLYGCINDVNAMQTLIRQPRFGFHKEHIKILTDETVQKPTAEDIKLELGKLIEAAKDGDTLLFYFSGGGALVKNKIPAIVPWDLHPIAGAHILPIINQLKHKAILTFIFDSSYSGGLFLQNDPIKSNVRQNDPIKSNVRQNDPIKSNVAVNVQNFGSKTIPPNLLQPWLMDVRVHPSNNAITFSSSEVNEESVEVYPNGDKSKAFSAFSNAIQTLLDSPQAGNDPKAGNTNGEVETFTTAFSGLRQFGQRPYLNCSGNDAAAPFLGGTVA